MSDKEYVLVIHNDAVFHGDVVGAMLDAIGAALVTMIGQNAGRGKIERVREIWWKSLDDEEAQALMPDAEAYPDYHFFLENVRRYKPFTLDEAMEVVTLVQTGKTRRIPIILVHRPFWEGLVGWFRDTLTRERTIAPEDLDLLQILDKPQEVVDAIFAHYDKRGFEPSPSEQEILLDL